MAFRTTTRSALVLIAIAVALGAIGAASGTWYLVVSMVLVIAVQAVSLWLTWSRRNGRSRP
jgi:membrane protein implicated in regulation of membrane protease activity